MLFSLVGRGGLEPPTNGLKVPGAQPARDSSVLVFHSALPALCACFAWRWAKIPA